MTCWPSFVWYFALFPKFCMANNSTLYPFLRYLLPDQVLESPKCIPGRWHLLLWEVGGGDWCCRRKEAMFFSSSNNLNWNRGWHVGGTMVCLVPVNLPHGARNTSVTRRSVFWVRYEGDNSACVSCLSSAGHGENHTATGIATVYSMTVHATLVVLSVVFPSAGE